MHFYPTHRQFSEKETKAVCICCPTIRAITLIRLIISWKGLNKNLWTLWYSHQFQLNSLRTTKASKTGDDSVLKPQLLLAWQKPCFTRVQYISVLSHINYILMALGSSWFSSEITADIQWVEDKMLLYL